MGEDKKIIIRQYREGDEEDLARLMVNNFPVTEGIEDIKETWLWQFKNHIFDGPHVMVAEDCGKIIAQYAVSSLRMNFIGKEIDAALSTSTVTDINYRGRGLFPQLAKLLYLHLKQRNCKLVYGFPNEQSIKTFLNKLSWFKVHKFPLLVKPMNFKVLLSRYFKKIILTDSLGCFLNRIERKLYKFSKDKFKLKDITIRPVTCFPEEVSNLWEKTHIKKRIAVIRDLEYLTWRYLNKPQGKYDVNIICNGDNFVGYFVTKLENKYSLNILFIMEIVVQEDERNIMSYAIDYIGQQARTMNADILSLLALNNHPNYSLFIRKGFFPIPESLLPNEIYFCAMINHEDILLSSIKNKYFWYITWGDTDII